MAKRYKLTNPLTIPRNDSKLKDRLPQTGEEEEDRSSTVVDERGTITGIPVLVPSDDKDVMHAIRLRKQYLRDTGVAGHMNKLTLDLLLSDELPYNPYPGFIRRFSKISERFHTRKKTLTEIHQSLSQPLVLDTKSSVIAGYNSLDYGIWGLRHIVMVLNPKKLSLLTDILKNLLDHSHVKNATIMSSVKGPAVFFGSFHDACYSVNVLAVVLVSASTVEDAAYSFAMSIIADLKSIHKESSHKILSVEVNVTEKDEAIKKFYILNDLEQALSSDTSVPSKNELLKQIALAATKKQDCTVNLMVDCKNNSMPLKVGHMRVSKSYSLLAILTKSTSSSKAECFYGGAPYQALHEGFFVVKSEADLYVTTLQKHSGYRSPLQSNVISTIEENWQQNIAGRQIESNITTVTHHGILMERIQNLVKPITSRKEDSLSIEIFRICQGLGMRLVRISVLVDTMIDIIDSGSLKSSNDMMKQTLQQYNDHLTEFFDSHDTAAGFGKETLLRIISDIDAALIDQNEDTVKSLLLLSLSYLKALSIGLNSDAIDGFPTMHQTLRQIDSAFGTKFGQNLETDVSLDKYRHKLETDTFADVERKIVNVAESSSSKTGLDIRQAKRLQYLMDIRVDQVWGSFLKDLFMSKSSLPPNPCPLLIAWLRAGSLQVQVHREEDKKLIGKVLTVTPKVFDAELKLYTISGVSAFGSLAAMAGVNSTGFKRTSTIAGSTKISSTLSQSKSNTSLGRQFDLKVLSALSGNSLLLNSATPYLSQVCTEDHCLIMGPEGLEIDGLSVLTAVLISSLKNLKEKGLVVTTAVFGDMSVDLTEFENSSVGFESQVASTLSTHEPFVINILVPMDWRFILVKKRVHIYYFNDATSKISFSTNYDNSLNYKQVFLSSTDAIDYAKRIAATKKSVRSLAMAIVDSASKQNWNELVQFVSAWCCDTKNPTTELTLLAWRFFHSPCGGLSYLIAVGEALQETVLHIAAFSKDKSMQKVPVSMLYGFRNGLHKFLSAKSTMVPSALNVYCQDLLQSSAPCNLNEYTADIDVDSLSKALSNVTGILISVLDNLASDLLHCTPSIKTLLKGN